MRVLSLINRNFTHWLGVHFEPNNILYYLISGLRAFREEGLCQNQSQFDSYYRSSLIILPLNLLRLSLQVDSHYRSTLNTGLTVFYFKNKSGLKKLGWK